MISDITETNLSGSFKVRKRWIDHSQSADFPNCCTWSDPVWWKPNMKNSFSRSNSALFTLEAISLLHLDNQLFDSSGSLKFTKTSSWLKALQPLMNLQSEAWFHKTISMKNKKIKPERDPVEVCVTSLSVTDLMDPGSTFRQSLKDRVWTWTCLRPCSGCGYWELIQ